MNMRKFKKLLEKEKLMGNCLICGNETWKYEAICMEDKIICSGCAEAIYYAFRKDFRNENFEESKDWINEMEHRLKYGFNNDGEKIIIN